MIVGSQIVAGRDGGGFRDFLDGEPINAGRRIEVWVVGHWLPGRYECDVHTTTAYFHTRLFDPSGDKETVIRVDRRTMQFRWPPREPGNDLAERLTSTTQAYVQVRSDLREVRAIIRRALDDEQEDGEAALRVRLRSTLLEIRAMIDAALR